MFRINKQKCVGCGVCVNNCPGATQIESDGKAEIVNQEKLEECGGESICPIEAIEKIDREEKTKTEIPSQPASQTLPFGGRGMGRGIGAGRGRGFGRGPRDGRGGGRGGGGRRY